MKTSDFNELLKEMKSKISKENTFEEGRELLSKLHDLVFPKELGNLDSTFETRIDEETTNEMYSLMPLKDEKTIAYYLYHTTRIEDITTSYLIMDVEQEFFNNNWQIKLNSSITSTGNELKKEQIEAFSKILNIDELKKYRLAVGKNSKELIRNLKYADLKRKANQYNLTKIIETGSVSKDEDAIWLVEYWGNKNVLGLILMPLTRHHMVHLNGCERILNKLQKMNK